MSSLFFSQLFTTLMDYGRRHGDHGRLPVTVNVSLEEFCNIGKLMDFKRVLNVCRGSAIFCQIIVQSIPQLQDHYVPHWRQEAEQPKKTAPPPEPSSKAEPAQYISPAASAPAPTPPLPQPSPPPPQTPASDPEQKSPAQSPGSLGPKYDYGLLDPEVDGYDGANPEDTPNQDSPYGAFDLIEALPQDVGGEHKEGQR